MEITRTVSFDLEEMLLIFYTAKTCIDTIENIHIIKKSCSEDRGNDAAIEATLWFISISESVAEM